MYTRYWIPYCRVLSKYSVWIYICCHTETGLLQILHAEVYLICNADVVVVPWSSSSFSEGYARPMLMPSSHQQNLPGERIEPMVGKHARHFRSSSSLGHTLVWAVVPSPDLYLAGIWQSSPYTIVAWKSLCRWQPSRHGHGRHESFMKVGASWAFCVLAKAPQKEEFLPWDFYPRVRILTLRFLP